MVSDHGTLQQYCGLCKKYYKATAQDAATDAVVAGIERKQKNITHSQNHWPCKRQGCGQSILLHVVLSQAAGGLQTDLKASKDSDHNANDLVLVLQGFISGKVASHRYTSQSSKVPQTGQADVNIEPPAGPQLGQSPEGGNHNGSRNEEAPPKTHQPAMYLQQTQQLT